MLRRLFHVGNGRAFRQDARSLSGVGVVLVLRRVSRKDFGVVDSTSRRPCRQGPLSREEVPNFRTEFRLQSVLLTNFCVLSVECRVILMGDVRIARCRPVRYRHLVRFVATILVFLALYCLLEGGEASKDRGAIYRQFAVRLISSAKVVRSQPLRGPLFSDQERATLRSAVRRGLTRSNAAALVARGVP